MGLAWMGVRKKRKALYGQKKGLYVEAYLGLAFTGLRWWGKRLIRRGLCRWRENECRREICISLLEPYMRVGEIWTRLERVRRPALLQEKNPHDHTKGKKSDNKDLYERNKTLYQIS